MKKIIAILILTSASAFAGTPPPPPIILQPGQSVIWCAIEQYAYQAAQDLNNGAIAAYNGTLTVSNDNHTYLVDWPFTISGLTIGQTTDVANAEVCMIVTKSLDFVRPMPAVPVRP